MKDAGMLLAEECDAKVREYDVASSTLLAVDHTGQLTYSELRGEKLRVEKLHDEVVDFQIRLLAAIEVMPILDVLSEL